MPPQALETFPSLDAAVRFTSGQVAEHNTKWDTYIVVDGLVYDVSKWMGRHPGGAAVIKQWAGQDASTAMASFHPEGAQAPQKMLSTMLVGRVDETYQRPGAALEDEFMAIRKQAQADGLFKPRLSFYSAHLAHIIVVEVLAWAFLWHYGVGPVTLLVASLIFTVSQAQAGWLQHDLGHLSVFPDTSSNKLAHKFVIGFLKAASASWWNWRHFQHHSKPNIIRMDPDVKMAYFFVIGDVVPKHWAAKGKGVHSWYNWQHRYWFLIGPPFLLPVYFHADVILRVLRKKDWVDGLWIGSFFARWFLLGCPLFGGFSLFGFGSVIAFYFFVRFVESHWFVWVTQMNHLPMAVDYHKGDSWVQSQLATTCNVEEGLFNDWFTGHLNWQIEHHLFPTMPRHNFYKVAPAIRALCTKHGLKYECKTLYGAFADIVESLRKSGELWLEAYHLDMPAPDAGQKDKAA